VNGRGSGHPAHQPREFTVRVRYYSEPGTSAIRVTAQTGHQALLLVGIALASTRPGTDPAGWVVTGIHDPAASR
jgi:hypothetical protein